MTETMQCPGCQSTLRVRTEHAGKSIRCPRCQEVIRIPKERGSDFDDVEAFDEGAITEVSPTPRKKPKQSKECPHCGEEVALRARKCPACRKFVDDRDDLDISLDDDDEPSFLPCPKCEAPRPERVSWTFWGSFYFTALFSHVRCQERGHTYNGRSGGSNLLVAIVCVSIPALLIAGIVGYTLWIVGQRQNWW